MTPAGTSNELDVQNGWEENTHTHTLYCTVSLVLNIVWWPGITINNNNVVGVRYNGGFLPDFILLTQSYNLRGTHFKCYGRGFVFVAYETTVLYTWKIRTDLLL